MDSILQDVRLGLRALKRSGGIIAIAILSLALGIGAVAAIFSIVDVFMIRPLPYPDSNRLHVLRLVNHERGMNHDSYTVPDFIDIREESRTLEVVATRTQTFNLSGDSEALRLKGTHVTPGFFNLLGVSPAQGRTFTGEEGVPGNERVAIISHELWQSRFGADPNTVGITILLDALPHTVVGIAPRRFWYRFPGHDVWAPLAFTGNESRESYNLNVLARVRSGYTAEQAREEGKAIMDRIAGAYPETSKGNQLGLETLHDHIFDQGFVAGSLICTVAAAFLLLIACANAANLLLTHAAGRNREVALRGVLGAGRTRIFRQFLTEALIVATLAGVVGMGVAVFGIRGLITIIPQELPGVHDIGLSPRVILFTAAVTMITGIVFGLAPAIRSARPDFASILKEGGQAASDARGSKVRKGLVAAEVAMATILLVSSALLVKGIRQLRASPNSSATWMPRPSSVTLKRKRSTRCFLPFLSSGSAG